MTGNTRKLSILTAALAAALLSFTALGSPAHAATARPAATAAGYIYFQIQNDTLGGCIQEDGDTSAVYMGSCGTNPSDWWRWTAADMLLNEHSGLCITVAGTLSSSAIYADNCTNNHVQLWDVGQYVLPVCFLESTCYTLDNVHTSELLAEEQEASGADGLTQVDPAGYSTNQYPFWDFIYATPV
jgi:hypothetical protein